jgi:hypothetical protein
MSGGPRPLEVLMRMTHALLLAAAALIATALVIGWRFAPPFAATAASRRETPPIPMAPATRVDADSPPQPVSPEAIWFSDVTAQSGITFCNSSGMTSEKHMPTAHGSGAAMLDFDQDGRLDLYFLTARPLPLEPASVPARNACYRQRADGTFQDVSRVCGLDVAEFGQGVAVGDVDNDGFPDVFLANYGPDRLLPNNGDGTFHGGYSAGVEDPRWATSAAFLDYDRDGNLDLYVARYAQWTIETHVACGIFDARDPQKLRIRTYCNPKAQIPERHSLYRGLGNGRFEDVTESLSLPHGGRGQGVVAADVNDDGWIDLYVANDQNPNWLFVNHTRGGFDDLSEYSGTALNAASQAEAGMGVDAGDVNRDGRLDLFVTNFYNEHNTLYRNDGQNLFVDMSMPSGVAAGSMDRVGWGTALEDLNQDGWLDILVVNGHVDDNLHEIGRDEPYREPSLIWENLGGGQFRHYAAGAAGPYFATSHVSRGAAFGDLDNDGDADVVVTHKDETPTILRNDSNARPESPPHRWIQLRLIGRRGNRDAVGARVRIEAAGTVLTRQIMGGRSYLSAHDLRLSVGLGPRSQVDRVTIQWPGGSATTLPQPPLDRLHMARETSPP